MRLALCCLAALVALRLFADEQLDKLGQALTLSNHLYGVEVEPNDLRGRLVIFWNLSEYCDAQSRQISTENASRKWDGSSYRRNRDNNKRDSENLTPSEQMREEFKALRTATKGAMKDGRILLVGVVSFSTNSDVRQEQMVALRSLKPPCATYDIQASTSLFNAEGNHLVSARLKDIAEGTHLSEALKAAPDYLPGRIVLYRTKDYESTTKLLTEGRNIEKALAQLQRDARSNTPKAAEAKQILDSVESYLNATCQAIERDIAAAPVRAVERILLLQKTLPARARKYQAPLNTFTRDKNFALLRQTHALIAQIHSDKMGKEDIGRNADSFRARLDQAAKQPGVNPAIAAEANSLCTLLADFTSEAIEKREATLRTERTERKKRVAEEIKRSRRNNSQSGSEPTGENRRVTPYDVLGKRIGSTATFEAVRAELSQDDEQVCNFEALRGKLETFATLKNDKAAAAQAAISAIDAWRSEISGALETSLKNDALLDFAAKDPDDWKRLLSVNFPSLKNAPLGRRALRILNDSEVRNIFTTYRAIENADPSDPGELLRRLKNLRRLLETRSEFGRLCVADLAKKGYSAENLKQKILDQEQALQEAKRSRKAAKKAQAESGS